MIIDKNKEKFQLECIETWKKLNYWGIMELPPGLGKSYIGYLLMSQIFKRNKNAKIIIVVPSIPLITQWTDKYLAMLPEDIDVSILTIQSQDYSL